MRFNLPVLALIGAVTVVAGVPTIEARDNVLTVKDHILKAPTPGAHLEKRDDEPVNENQLTGIHEESPVVQTFKLTDQLAGLGDMLERTLAEEHRKVDAKRKSILAKLRDLALKAHHKTEKDIEELKKLKKHHGVHQGETGV